MNKLSGYLTITSRVLASIGLLALMLVSTLTVVDALMRRFFASNINGLSDWVEWCIVVAVSACIPAMVWGRHAITVRVLGSVLPWRLREMLESFGQFLLAITLFVIVWQLFIYTQELYEFGDVSMLLQWKKWPVWTLATGLWSIALILQLIIFMMQCARIFASSEPNARETERVT